MDEETQKRPKDETDDPAYPGKQSDLNSVPASPEQGSMTYQSSMKFAPLQQHTFGPSGSAISPYDMRHMSNALAGYPHAQMVQPAPPTQFAHASNVDPNSAYTASSSQQFAGQLPKQYALHSNQQMNTQVQRNFPGYQHNVPGGSSYPQTREHLYSPQQQFAYGTNLSHMSQPPAFVGQQFAQTPTRMAPPRIEVNMPQVGYAGSSIAQIPQVVRRTSSNSSLQNSAALRGPPRKPKKSGHALWVGNLPPGTRIADLKDHFSREATDDIESVFLISKSNCAFVNYKSEESCAAAMARFHDSKFGGVRLVCRLRRGSNSAISLSASTPQQEPNTLTAEPPAELQAPITTEAPGTETPPKTIETGQHRVKEKFFIIKSLTVDDLERSVTNGIWATQAHNEEVLNTAFDTADNVYLIFSANKSGEYFGYARMESPIGTDVAFEAEKEIKEKEQSTAAPQTLSSADVPVTIPTPATATAPRGYIIDDSARGTIFWEADSGTSTPSTATDSASQEPTDVSTQPPGQSKAISQQTTFGKPFRISWQSTERLAFYRTRGLRNPWNANREVKIARDGTELEPTVGRKLIGMFEQQAQMNLMARTTASPAPFGYVQQVAQYPPGMMPQPQYGFPQGSGHPYGHPY